MPRKLIKRYLPDPHSIKENRFLKIFGKVLHDPQLWHLTRASVSRAFAIGLFCAFIPIPFQMFIAVGSAILFRANIAISFALVWITNPLTIPLFFGFAYFVGLWFFGQPTDNTCLICSTVSALIGYFSVRLFWRFHIVSAWKERKIKRMKKA